MHVLALSYLLSLLLLCGALSCAERIRSTHDARIKNVGSVLRLLEPIFELGDVVLQFRLLPFLRIQAVPPERVFFHLPDETVRAQVLLDALEQAKAQRDEASVHTLLHNQINSHVRARRHEDWRCNCEVALEQTKRRDNCCRFARAWRLRQQDHN